MIQRPQECVVTSLCRKVVGSSATSHLHAVAKRRQGRSLAPTTATAYDTSERLGSLLSSPTPSPRLPFVALVCQWETRRRVGASVLAMTSSVLKLSLSRTTIRCRHLISFAADAACISVMRAEPFAPAAFGFHAAPNFVVLLFIVAVRIRALCNVSAHA